LTAAVNAICYQINTQKESLVSKPNTLSKKDSNLYDLSLILAA